MKSFLLVHLVLVVIIIIIIIFNVVSLPNVQDVRVENCFEFRDPGLKSALGIRLL